MRIARSRFVALARRYPRTNPSSRQSRRHLVPSFKKRRVFHQLAPGIEHERVSRFRIATGESASRLAVCRSTPRASRASALSCRSRLATCACNCCRTDANRCRARSAALPLLLSPLADATFQQLALRFLHAEALFIDLLRRRWIPSIIRANAASCAPLHQSWRAIRGDTALPAPVDAPNPPRQFRSPGANG